MENQTSNKILVVDSQPRTRSIYLKMLRLKGFEATGVESSQAAISAVQLEPPALIICDETTETSNQCSLIKAASIRPDTAVIPIVLLLAALSRAAIGKAASKGASACLVQPIEAEELCRVVSSQLERQAKLRRYYSQPDPSAVCPSALSQIANTIDDVNSPLSQALQYISANHTRSIALSDVAQFVGYSPSYLTNQMRKETGQTIQQWIIQLRMATACSLLLNTNCSVEDVAAQVGYHNTTHFFRQFRRLYDTTPRAWRKQRCQL